MLRKPASALLPLVCVLVLLGWYWWRGEQFIAANGPTFDEYVHLTAGYGYWTNGAFRLNSEDPPLLKLLWAAPLLFHDAPPFPLVLAEATQFNHWHVAQAWVFDSGVAPRTLLDPARRVNLFLGMCLVTLVGWVAYRVFGAKWAGVVAVAYAANDPNLVALGCVLSTDLGLALFGFLTCYLAWEYVAAPSRGLLIAVGVSLGLALAAKFSAVALVVGLCVAAGGYWAQGGVIALPGQVAEPRIRNAFELVIRVAVIAVIIIAATYGFVHFPEWGRGLKFQLTRGEHGDGIAYLNGERSQGGWWHYFAVALLLKLPLGLLVATATSAIFLLLAKPRSPGTTVGNRNLFLIVPPIVFFLLASYSRVNIGVRVVLPISPFVYLVAAGLVVPGDWALVRRLILVVCLVCSGFAAQSASPNDITYFNELAGGTRGGARYLADSNLDWGQGLPALQQWMRANRVEVVYLGYFGTDRPESYGLRYQPLPGYGRTGDPGCEAIPASAPQHIVAVSVNHLLGLYLNDPHTYSFLRQRTPVAVPGGSIAVFDLTEDPEALRQLRVLPSR